MAMTRLSIGCALAAGAAWWGCGGGTPPPDPRDAGPIIRTLRAEVIVTYEGQPRFVTVVDSDGIDLEGATVRPREDAVDVFTVTEQLCHRTACGVVLRMNDTRPSVPQPIPRPADARNHFLAL